MVNLIDQGVENQGHAIDCNEDAKKIRVMMGRCVRVVNREVGDRLIVRWPRFLTLPGGKASRDSFDRKGWARRRKGDLLRVEDVIGR